MFSFFTKKNQKAQQVGQRDCSWCKVDEAWLSSGTYLARGHEVIHGPVARFFDDGQLASLSLYQRGQISTTHHQLELKLGIPEALVSCHGIECRFSYGWEEVFISLDGEHEVMVEAAVWEEWINKWIKLICNGERVCRLNNVVTDEFGPDLQPGTYK